VTYRSDRREAFCARATRPQVFVSDSLAPALDEAETKAVLIHEHDHARRFEPLRRAALRAAAEVFFYLPLVRWLGDRRLELSELRADRVALEQLGPRPLAGALWALGNAAILPGMAAFGGAAELRVAQVLGEPLPKRSLRASTIVVSAMGGYLALQVGSCLVQAVTHL
jgi:Zn-dependent protease with chaperone function